MARILIDKVGSVIDWLEHLFDKWLRCAHKEQKKKNKIPVKISPLQIIKSLT